MRYRKYLIEENSIITDALNIPEPKVGGNYATEKVKRYIKIIEDALSAMSKKEENDTNDAIVQDLRDKLKSWKNVDKETKPVKTKPEIPPEQQEQPPEQQQQEQPPEQKEDIVIKHISMLIG